MKASTPATPKAKDSETPDISTDPESEFTERFLYLFTSFYEFPNEQYVRPKTAKSKTKKKTIEQQTPTSQQKKKALPFHSGVWDLKLQRALEERIEKDKVASEQISEQVLQIRESLSTQKPNINNVFLPPKVEIPEVPRYMQNIEKDEKEFRNFSHTRAKPSNLNFQENSRIFSEKLKKQKERTKTRAAQRYIRMQELEKQNQEFISNLFHYSNSSVTTPKPTPKSTRHYQQTKQRTPITKDQNRIENEEQVDIEENAIESQ